mmetsp:Transcript_15797/g.22006  ORF Transcript_15797/g.22006 Transcript_15797/m.22006 type:complete len:119 (-) Transcript_15797:41-397(-)|eukprot:CAMPEP_0168559498 /NCGR_PEP_ID=MMETSP0413-20121227/10557_1 /TAXON_ID=136452 /ORGANISM="Filamoeba nolandi, Strain NC-AS-23-1" /LENGTH=118 /DNA_ID=CAMNT_0008590733 /DNA_START=110 /DNA_END=466 /DNA_ORIENTATION=-
MADKLELEVRQLRSIQKQISNLADSRAQFLTQLNENEMVKKELELVENGGEVFKMIGPALVKQEKVEAVSNVSKRIEFIQAELKKIENTIKDLETKQETQRKKVVEMQMQLQQQAPKK